MEVSIDQNFHMAEVVQFVFFKHLPKYPLWMVMEELHPYMTNMKLEIKFSMISNKNPYICFYVLRHKHNKMIK